MLVILHFKSMKNNQLRLKFEVKDADLQPEAAACNTIVLSWIKFLSLIQLYM